MLYDPIIQERGEYRNLIDHYHYWRNEAILADLDSKRNSFISVCINIGYDFNIATVIRNSNAFSAGKVVIYGRKRYDKRGTVGTHKYTHVCPTESIEELKSILSDYHVVGVDNVSNAVPLETYQWSREKPTALVFGQEQIGIPEEILELCDDVVYIKQYGSVRSLNVGTASGIAMYDYCSKIGGNINV
jgi:tRNA G18 (ribose-2'-O)-methylase SpoU